MLLAGLVSGSKLSSLSECLTATRLIGETRRHSPRLGLSSWSTTTFPGRPFSSSFVPLSPLHNFHQRTKERGTLVLNSSSNNPYHNLAIEHFILTHSDTDSCILFLYTNRPCVVIGRNQNPWTECNLKLLQQGLNGRPIDLVRRHSGGGTVFHDEGNLNFSVIVPNNKDFTRRKHAELVVEALKNTHTVLPEHDGPKRIRVNDRHDITMATLHDNSQAEFKVSGSAFKLTRGRALHHGTILHSSPHLESISRLLRSPGREYIRAKGVESVRSPVMNVFNVRDASEREHLRSQLVEKIVEEFLKFYDASATVDMVGDADCLPEVNLSIADGVHELLTDAWRFEQTPRFEFESKTVGGKQISFAIRSGLLEDSRLGALEVPIEQRPILQIPKLQKLHQIRDWYDLFNPEIVDDAQIAAVTQVFPDLQKLLHDSHLDSSTPHDGSVQLNWQDSMVRKHSDGTVERETGQNTIQEIKV